MPPSSGFPVGSNLETSPQMMLSDVRQFHTWQRLASKLNWMRSSPMTGSRAWVTVFLNGMELPWWIPFSASGDRRGWDIIRSIEISSTNMVGEISNLTVSYCATALPRALEADHEAHIDFLNEVYYPAMREREREEILPHDPSSSDEDSQKVRTSSLISLPRCSVCID